MADITYIPIRQLLTLNATSAAKLAMTTAMRSSCAERSMANDRPCKV